MQERNGPIGFLKRILSLFARPEPPMEERCNVVAAPDKGGQKQRRKRAKEIKACYLHFDGVDFKGMVLSLSDRGADIRLPHHLERLPDTFTLKFPHGESHDCVIRWRERGKVGVAFR